MSERRCIIEPHNQASSYKSFSDIGDESPVLIHVLPSTSDRPIPWHQHVQDLDNFLINVYKYHQKSGFTCLVVGQILDIVQFIVFALLTFFFVDCINYDILFNHEPVSTVNNPTGKVHIYDVVVIPSSIPPIQKFAIFVALLYLTWKIIKSYISITLNISIKQFYHDEMHITNCSSLSWQDVQAKIIAAKKKLTHKPDLNELDISNRILRHPNYVVALVNRGILPIYFKVPIFGELTYFPKSFLYNCQLLFFRGPFKCIFEENWKLFDDIKNPAHRQTMARILEKRILILALINFILSPVILVWLLAYYFYSNAAQAKRDPAALFATRDWSLYARWFCRHFNELEHQLNERLNHGYKPANNYMNAFISPLLELIGRFTRSISGSIVIILVFLTIYDEDVLRVEHVLTIITGLTILVYISHSLISPEIPQKFTKTELYDQIIQHIHYVPNNYPAFTPQARKSMSDLFHFKLYRLCEDLISTLATPYIMMRHLRPRSLAIIDFFRNYTAEIPSLGDVCVFSIMNIRKNGNPAWHQSLTEKHEDSLKSDNNLKSPKDTSFEEEYHEGSDSAPLADPNEECIQLRESIPTARYQNIDHDIGPLQTEHGKLELSLLNFKLRNASWNPPDIQQKHFIDQVTSKASETLSSRQVSLSQQVDLPLNDSANVISLSTLFLHEQARQPLSSRLPSSSLFSQLH